MKILTEHARLLKTTIGPIYGRHEHKRRAVMGWKLFNGSNVKAMASHFPTRGATHLPGHRDGDIAGAGMSSLLAHPTAKPPPIYHTTDCATLRGVRAEDLNKCGSSSVSLS